MWSLPKDLTGEILVDINTSTPFCQKKKKMLACADKEVPRCSVSGCGVLIQSVRNSERSECNRERTELAAEMAGGGR